MTEARAKELYLHWQLLLAKTAMRLPFPPRGKAEVHLFSPSNEKLNFFYEGGNIRGLYYKACCDREG
jgi:hypothetical protein